MSELIEVVKSLQDTPVPQLLVLAGVLFLFFAFMGRVSGALQVPKERQRWMGIVGGLLLIAGIGLSVPWPGDGNGSAEALQTPSPTPVATAQVIVTLPPTPPTMPQPDSQTAVTAVQESAQAPVQEDTPEPASPDPGAARPDRISGTMTYRGDGVPGLSVALVEGTDCVEEKIVQRTATDEMGRYAFLDVAPGSYLVNINGLYDDAIAPLEPYEQTCSGELIKTADDALPLNWSLHKTDLRITYPLKNTSIGTTEPTIQWQPYPGASRYEVVLIKDAATSDIVLDEYVSDTTVFVPTQPLLPGGSYRLYVWAWDDAGQIAVGDTYFQVQ